MRLALHLWQRLEKVGVDATGTNRMRSSDTPMSVWMSLIEFSLTTTMRGKRLATLPCIFTNEYQREIPRRFHIVLVCAISSLRSLVIGWCSVTMVGMIFSIDRMCLPRHWLSCTRSKSAVRSRNARYARRLNVSGSAKVPFKKYSASSALGQLFSSQYAGNRPGY